MELLEDAGQILQPQTQSVPTRLRFSSYSSPSSPSTYPCPLGTPLPTHTHTLISSGVRSKAPLFRTEKHFQVYLEGLQVPAPTASSAWKENEKHFFSSSSFSSCPVSWCHLFKHFIPQLATFSTQGLQLQAPHISIASSAQIEPPLMMKHRRRRRRRFSPRFFLLCCGALWVADLCASVPAGRGCGSQQQLRL